MAFNIPHWGAIASGQSFPVRCGFDGRSEACQSVLPVPNVGASYRWPQDREAVCTRRRHIP